jgi:hypothetical protein
MKKYVAKPYDAAQFDDQQKPPPAPIKTSDCDVLLEGKPCWAGKVHVHLWPSLQIAPVKHGDWVLSREGHPALVVEDLPFHDEYMEMDLPDHPAHPAPAPAPATRGR